MPYSYDRAADRAAVLFAMKISQFLAVRGVLRSGPYDADSKKRCRENRWYPDFVMTLMMPPAVRPYSAFAPVAIT